MPTNLAAPLGLPFARNIRVVGAKNVWPDLEDLEVRSQLRASASSAAALIANFHPFMSWDFDDDDLVITWSMTGADVRAINRDGFYDVVVSDAGETDARAIVILAGQFTFPETVTTAAGDAA